MQNNKRLPCVGSPWVAAMYAEVEGRGRSTVQSIEQDIVMLRELKIKMGFR